MTQVQIERVGNRIHARSVFNAALVQEFRQLSGNWLAEKKIWTFRLDIEVCRRLREICGDDLQIGPELWKWAAAETAREKALLDIANAPIDEPYPLQRVPEMAPRMWEAMKNKPYQTVMAAYGAAAQTHLNADDQGLGKTLESLAAIVERGSWGPWLIACPKTSILNVWEPEIVRWLGGIDGGAMTYSPAFREGRNGNLVECTKSERQESIRDFWDEANSADAPRLSFCIVNAEMLRTQRVIEWCEQGARCQGFWDCSSRRTHKVVYKHEFPELFENMWQGVIVDEVHRWMLNMTGKRPSQVGLGLERLPTQDMRIALSGTPMKGKPTNLFGVIHWLRPQSNTSKWGWREMWLASKANRFAYSGREFLDEVRKDRREEFDRHLGTVMMRRTKKELYAQNTKWAPPPKEYITVPIELGAAQRKAYDAVVKSGTVLLPGGRLDVNGILAEMTRLKQLASCSGQIDDQGHFRPALPSAKFEWLTDSLLPGLGIAGDNRNNQGTAKVVIASQFTQMINLWSDALKKMGILNYRLTGETNANEERKIISDWQSNNMNVRVLLLNTMKGGVSITLDRADYLVIMDETWVPDDQLQVEDRIHRTSRVDHQVTIYVLRSRNTIEEEILGQTLETKASANFEYLDAKRAMAWARENVS